MKVLRNLKPKKEHADEARYIGESMRDNVLFLLVQSESNEKNRMTLPRVPCVLEDEDFPITGF